MRWYWRTLPADGESIHARQHPVEDDDIWGLCCSTSVSAVRAVEGLHNGMPLALQVPFDEVAEVHLILDEQYRRHRPCSPLHGAEPTPPCGEYTTHAIPSTTRNWLPSPGALAALIEPPIACTRSRAMESPNPKPPEARAREASVR